jgi:hypothetical protein
MASGGGSSSQHASPCSIRARASASGISPGFGAMPTTVPSTTCIVGRSLVHIQFSGPDRANAHQRAAGRRLRRKQYDPRECVSLVQGRYQRGSCELPTDDYRRASRSCSLWAEPAFCGVGEGGAAGPHSSTFHVFHVRWAIKFDAVGIVRAINPDARGDSGDCCPILQRECLVRCYTRRWQELLLREPPTMSGRE